jgi:PadR family transcriptional regulator PadR
MISKELLKGTLKTIILHLLDEKGRMYGYEITQEVKRRTNDKLKLTEGALYPSLHKLEADGLIKSQKEYIGKRLRKYYSLSQAGYKATKKKTNEYHEFNEMMNRILSNQPEVALNGTK